MSDDQVQIIANAIRFGLVGLSIDIVICTAFLYFQLRRIANALTRSRTNE